MVDKAVILAAGSATRMQKNIEKYIANEKELLTVKKGEKMAACFEMFPFLDYQILNLVHAGMKEINIVLKADDTFFINHYDIYGKTLFPEVEISYSFQEIPDGTAHAALAAEEFINDERFILLNGDNNYPEDSLKMLLSTPEDYSSMVAFDTECFNIWTRERLKSFAVIRTLKGKLEEIIEKSQDPENYMTCDYLYTKNNGKIEVRNKILTSMNLWCFSSEIMDMCKKVRRHEPRKFGKEGEYELPDAVELLIKEGIEILVYYSCGDILDLTRAEDIEVVGEQIRKNLSDKVIELKKRYKRL